MVCTKASNADILCYKLRETFCVGRMGGALGVMHVLATPEHSPQPISVSFSTRVVPETRAQSLGVIEPNSL